jgi:hypothetical protein
MLFTGGQNGSREDTVGGEAFAWTRRCLTATVAVIAVCAVVGVAPALAGVAWSVRSIAEPTQFSPADQALCENETEDEGYLCDKYLLVVRNVGDTTSSGTVVVTDHLPLATAGGAEEEYEEGHGRSFGGAGWACSSEVVAGRTTVTCQRPEASVAPEAYAVPPEAGAIRIPVVAPTATSGVLKNEVTVTGGGASEAGDGFTVEEAPIGTQRPPFEVADFAFDATAVGGGASTQAGGHPGDVTANLQFSSFLRPTEEGYGIEHFDAEIPVESPRSASVELPLGLIGDPQATPTCSEADLNAAPEGRACPPESRIGIATLNTGGHLYLTGGGAGQSESAIYNVTPQGGYPAEFGFAIAGRMVILYASVVHTDAGYRLRASNLGIPAIDEFIGTSLTFFGDPGAIDGVSGAHVPFLTNPMDCSAGALSARVEADSWENPGLWVSKESLTYPQVTGCDLLTFATSFAFAPSSVGEGGTSQADEPSAYTVDLKVPQTNESSELATPPVKSVSVMLPEGVVLSPGAADGLVGCSEAQIDLASTERGACPLASQIATAEAITPILANPLPGRVYVAQPKCGGEGQPGCTAASASNGELFGLYLEVQGPGFVVKFPGVVSVDPGTGRVTARFEDLIQQPVSELRVHLKGGSRAPLANPQTCGQATATSDLTPWSSPATPDAVGSSAFNVDWDGNGGACPAGLPFAPAFNAGTVSPGAGAYSPFTLTVSRGDREQNLSGVSVTMPPGLLGKIAGIPLCGEPQAEQGTCPATSQIGSTTALAGSGSHPFGVSGRVYLTGGYKGAPFGLSIVVPAVAGPFNLGNVVVRAAVNVDPHTAQITVASDPLPSIVDGVPLRVRTVNVMVDRPGFIFNPTDCEPLSVGGTLTSTQGATANVSSRFQAGGCASLGFHPSFTVSTQAKTSKQGGAGLVVRTSLPAGAQANFHSVAVSLPKQLPSRLTTIQQACPEAVFAANPASCPAGSDVGMATATTPVLAGQVSGPAYLVSHGGAAFPDLVVILQGEGVTVDLVGSIDIKKGVTSSTFANLPDAPIGSFTLTFPEGPHSALTTNLPAKAKGSLCGQNLTMPTTITAQNGAVIKQSTKIAVTGCAKVKPKPKAKKHKKRVKGKKKR